jgi:sulfur carrier protein
MQMRINGIPVAIEKDMSVEQLILDKKLIPQRIVVEVNRQIVPREEWRTIPLKDGDEIEIVSFVAGG